jgi:CBS domain-containing protein
MLARDVMTTHVVTVRPDAGVREVARIMLEHGVSAVPVVDEEERPLGMVSEGDLMRRPETGGARPRCWWLALFAKPEARALDFVRSHGGQARDVMSDKLVTVGEEASLRDIATVLEEHRIKRVPVVRDGRIVGIVSRANLLHGLVAAAPEETAPGDEAIRDAILTKLRHEVGLRDLFLNVTVAGGIVHLWGDVPSEAERRAARVAAETAAGVAGVKDHLTVMASREAAWGE